MKSKITILGGGESGVGAAILAQQKGYEVFVSDYNAISTNHADELNHYQIEFEIGKHSKSKILLSDEIIKSPGIPESTDIMKAIRLAQIPVSSEIEFAYRHIGKGKIVAITGSNGKSTTTSLLYQICCANKTNAALVGNIGYSIAKKIALNPSDWYITEVSSFQLDDIKTFHPKIAIITNISEDHLDRYDYKLENYIHAKLRISENMDYSDFLIYNIDDVVLNTSIQERNILTNHLPFTMKNEVRQGAYIKNEQMLLKIKEQEVRMNINDFKQKGLHNQYNTMAAGLAAMAINIRDEKIRESIRSFDGLEHRMEYILSVRGVDYINDSKATNVNSTWYALESLTKPAILILGGVDKGNDYSIIEELVKEKVKGIVCLGIDNQKIHTAFENLVEFVIDVKSAEEAASICYSKSTSGDVVLLSPACASFDLFKNYEDRGRQFKAAVKNL